MTKSFGICSRPFWSRNFCFYLLGTQMDKTCLEKVHVMIWSDLDGIFILWHHDTMFERVKMICTAFLGPQWWIMCILSPRDIMVVREVFMMYFFLEMVYIKSRYSDHVIFIWDMICNSHFELSMTPFSMTLPPLSQGDKSAFVGRYRYRWKWNRFFGSNPFKLVKFI